MLSSEKSSLSQRGRGRYGKEAPYQYRTGKLTSLTRSAFPQVLFVRPWHLILLLKISLHLKLSRIYVTILPWFHFHHG